MLTPSEFMSLYGTPVVRTVTIAANSVFTIPANEDRYLLVFMWNDNDLVITFRVDDASIIPQKNMVTNSSPLIFTHALHGSLLNLEWQIQNFAIGVDAHVQIVEGRMTKGFNKSKRKK